MTSRLGAGKPLTFFLQCMRLEVTLIWLVAGSTVLPLKSSSAACYSNLNCRKLAFIQTTFLKSNKSSRQCFGGGVAFEFKLVSGSGSGLEFRI